VRASLVARAIATVGCTRPDWRAEDQVPTTQLMRTPPVKPWQESAKEGRAEHCVDLIVVDVEGGMKH
jgi:hypothetical protein